jgi:hypothetical protein
MLTTSQEQKVMPPCPVKNCKSKPFADKSKLTRHITDIVNKGRGKPLYAEHKAAFDEMKNRKKRSSLGLAAADVTTDPAKNPRGAIDYGGVRGQRGLTMRGSVGAGAGVLPTPAGWAGVLSLPAGAAPHARASPIPPHARTHAGTGIQYPTCMEPDEPDADLNDFDFDMMPNMTGQAEASLPAAHNPLQSSLLNTGGMDQPLDVNGDMVPPLGAGVYGGPGLDQMEPWYPSQLFGNELGYMGNLGQLPGGGFHGGFTGSLDHPDVYNGQTGGVVPDPWQLPDATTHESQQGGGY